MMVFLVILVFFFDLFLLFVVIGYEGGIVFVVLNGLWFFVDLICNDFGVV